MNDEKDTIDTVEKPENESMLITDDNIDAFKALTIKSQINDLTQLANDVKAKQQEMSMSNTDVDFIDANIKPYTLAEIKAMTDTEIAKLCTSEDGTLFLNDFENDGKNKEFRRDYIIFRKESNDALENIDIEMEKLNAAYAEYEAEMDDILKQCGDMTLYLKKTLSEKMENATDDKKKERYADMIKHIDLALTLDNVIEYYSNSYRAKTAITNIKAPKAGKQAIKRYEKVIYDVGCKTDFRKFGGLEIRYLPDEYKATYPNAFMYSMINFIASWYNNEDNVMNGLFLAQFSVNLKNLINDKFPSEEDKNIFIKAICNVIDLVG